LAQLGLVGYDRCQILIKRVFKNVVHHNMLELEASLYQTLQILSVTLFEKTPILQALRTFDMEENLLQDANQLILFNL
jgi:hypothetical protein